MYNICCIITKIVTRSKAYGEQKRHMYTLAADSIVSVRQADRLKEQRVRGRARPTSPVSCLVHTQQHLNGDALPENMSIIMYTTRGITHWGEGGHSILCPPEIINITVKSHALIKRARRTALLPLKSSALVCLMLKHPQHSVHPHNRTYNAPKKRSNFKNFWWRHSWAPPKQAHLAHHPTHCPQTLCNQERHCILLY